MGTSNDRNGVKARLRGSRWYVRISWRGGRPEFPTDATNETDALRIGRARLAEFESGRACPEASRTTVAELWDDLRADYAINERHVPDLQKRWNHLEAVFGRDLATDVSTPRLRRYVERRLAAGAARATVRLELAALRRAFSLGVEAAKVVRVPVFPTIEVRNVRTGFVEGDALERLLAELPPELRVLATLASSLGWRRSELTGLEWRQIDLDRNEVRLDPGSTKNRDGRVAFLPPTALEVLREWRVETDRVERTQGRIVRYVIHRDGDQVRSHYAAWRSACVRAGVPGLMLHDLRRSAARAYVRSGVPEAVVMRVLGHRTRSMLDRYNVISEADLRDAAVRVEAGGGAAPAARTGEVVALAGVR